jgi:hypothetical protein
MAPCLVTLTLPLHVCHNWSLNYSVLASCFILPVLTSFLHSFSNPCKTGYNKRNKRLITRALDSSHQDQKDRPAIIIMDRISRTLLIAGREWRWNGQTLKFSSLCKWQQIIVFHNLCLITTKHNFRQGKCSSRLWRSLARVCVSCWRQELAQLLGWR